MRKIVGLDISLEKSAVCVLESWADPRPARFDRVSSLSCTADDLSSDDALRPAEADFVEVEVG